VREAYRRLAKRFHPDRHPDGDATEQMQRINQAWEMLSSPEARARYDAASVPPVAAYAHWGGVPRTSYPRYDPRPQYGAAPSWAASRASSAAEVMGDDEVSTLRWVLLFLLVVPALVLLAALSGGFLPFPFLGLFVLLIARAVIGSRD
jgi:hypothetical protein